jgi:hypothetical protein
MRITANARRGRLAVITGDALRLYDVSTGDPREIGSLPLAGADCIASCDASLAVVTGKVAPAGASIRNARLARYTWDLAPLDSPGIGEVARHHISLDADGARAVTTDWKTCEVVIIDAVTGKKICGNDRGIPSGAAFSPDGARVIAGSADQGSGDILLFDVAAAAGPSLPMERLPEPSPSPGLDDAPYFGVFSGDGALAAVSNESWGGRGLFVYDIARKQPVWSVELPHSADDAEAWFAFPTAFAAGDRVLLASGPASIAAYAVADGRALGAITVEGDGRGGFAIDEARWVAWVPGAPPRSHALPAAWRDASAGTAAAKPKRAPAKKTTPKKTTPKKTTPKKTAAKKTAAKR